MQWARPKSLSGLMLLGLGLMAVPLVAAIVTALLQMRVLADTGQRIIVEGVSAARASQLLFGQIASLERTARLFNVLGDPKLLDLYRSEDERLTLTRDPLRRPFDPGQHQRRDHLRSFRTLHPALGTGRAGGAAEQCRGRQRGGRARV